MTSSYIHPKPPRLELGWGSTQLCIISPTVPEPDDKLLLEEPFDYHLHVSKMIDAIENYWYWLDKTGSLILHHNPLPINVPLNHPISWIPPGKLKFHQFLAWDEGTTVNQRHPDWFHGRVECLWWLVKDTTYKFDKRHLNNLLTGTFEEIARELILCLSSEEDLVISNKEELRDVCNEIGRRFKKISI